MNLWIDDVREPPDDTWAVARTYDEAWTLLRRYQYDVASFDHDLGDLRCASCGGDMYHYAGCGAGEHGERIPLPKTGYDLLLRVELGALNCPGEIRLHSMNPVGRRRMATVVDSMKRRGIYGGPDVR